MSARHMLLLVAGLVNGPSGAQDGPGPKVGEAYPGLVLPSLADGAPLSIARFRGKKVLLLQFASW